MNRVRVSWILALLSLLAAPAHAAWSIGPNFGVNVLNPRDGGDALTTIAWPGSTGQIVFGLMPGLRIGAATGGKDAEFYLDTGFYRLSSNGSSFTSLEATANFQYNFNEDATTPYVTAGGGLIHASIEGETPSLTNGVFGAGLGVRHRVKHGYGTFRAEARFDSITEDKTGFRGGTLVSLKLGFDLWMD